MSVRCAWGLVGLYMSVCEFATVSFVSACAVREGDGVALWERMHVAVVVDRMHGEQNSQKIAVTLTCPPYAPFFLL